MNAPKNLRYTKDHEWVRRDGDVATIGITDFAQSELGDIVYVELPETGSTVESGREFGTVESVKAVSEVYAPVSGEVIAVNDELREHPELVNADPYENGWILRVRASKVEEFAVLMAAGDYERFVEAGAGH